MGGGKASLAEAGGQAAGKANIIAGRALVRGNLRFFDPGQLARTKETMQKIVARHLPEASAELRFDDRYPALVETDTNRALLGKLDEVSRDLGYGPLVSCDPRSRGAGDAAFVSPLLPTIDGLGVRGSGTHTPDEDIDLASVPELVQRAALLIYRLTR